MRTLALSCICTGIAAMSIVPVLGQAQPTLETRLKVLEDRDAIRMLLVSYASTLDNRDFAGFEQLWAKDAEFVGGGNSAKGPAAIRALLQGLLKKNAAPVPGRDFHLVMNQTVDVKGDTATGFSRGTWVSTNAETKRLQWSIIANYYDQFVREDGRWKFKRHQIGGTPPAGTASN